MGLLDIILFPVYVFMFHLYFSYARKKMADPQLKFYHKYAFWVKIIGSLAITIFNVYISLGDSTTLYYREGYGLYKLILNDGDHLKWFFTPGLEFDANLITDPANTGYYKSDANFFIIKMVAFFSFFSLGKYTIINLFFSMLAFSGIWKLFLFFYERYPAYHKKIAIAVLFLPTVVFWSSGALKDPVCMGMLGWLTYSLYEGFYKKRHLISNTFIALICIGVISVVKSYIVFSYLPFFILYLILINVHQVKNTLGKVAIFLMIVIGSIAGLFLASEKLQEEMGNLALDKLAESVQSQQNNFINMAGKAESSFSLGVEYDGTVGSLIKIAPAAINATLFRPYLWESKKISTLLSSLESLSLMFFFLFVLKTAGPVRFVKTIFKDPMILFCLLFSVLFAFFIGATTLNFGTLVRYKIPCMPFFIIALVLIYEYNKPIKKAHSVKQAS